MFVSVQGLESPLFWPGSRPGVPLVELPAGTTCKLLEPPAISAGGEIAGVFQPPD
jgi:hypothetical protein